jgi:Protein of unknown function (DUF1554)
MFTAYVRHNRGVGVPMKVEEVPMNRSYRVALLGVAMLAGACTPFTHDPRDGGDGGAGAKGAEGGAGVAGDGGSDVATEAAGGGGADSATEAAGDGGRDVATEASGDGGFDVPRDHQAGEDSMEVSSDRAPEVPTVCGDGVPTPPEECDLGTAANTGAYGKCTKDCKLAPRCGDGKVNDVSEVCDNGADNGFGTGNCNPACSGLVAEKTIKVVTSFPVPGAIQRIEDADLVCQTYAGGTYRALLVDGDVRVATKTPYKGDGQVDWVLRPYTRYLTTLGNLIWITDDVALLGVRNGQPVALLNPILPGPIAFAWVGFENDWTSSVDNCLGWNSSLGTDGGTVIRVDQTEFIVDPAQCSNAYPLICAERY